MGHILERAPHDVSSVLRRDAIQNFMVQPGADTASGAQVVNWSDVASSSWDQQQQQQTGGAQMFPTWSNWDMNPAQVEAAPAAQVLVTEG